MCQILSFASPKHPASPSGSNLIEKVRIRYMDLFRVDANDWTIFSVHITDSEDILAALYDIIVKLIPVDFDYLAY